MTPIKVKICGLKSPEAIDAAVEAGADWLGFNFFPASPRYVSPEQAAALASRHPDGPSLIGLFVNPTEDDIAAATTSLRLSALQIYGPADFGILRRRFNLPVWRPVGVASKADLPRDAMAADMLLLEAKPPAMATRPGGNATTFDWTVMRNWTAPAPWLLAGGLTPANVSDAIRTTGARAVDVSSGVEQQPGRKDPELIRAFIRAAREAG